MGPLGLIQSLGLLRTLLCPHCRRRRARAKAFKTAVYVHLQEPAQRQAPQAARQLEPVTPPESARTESEHRRVDGASRPHVRFWPSVRQTKVNNLARLGKKEKADLWWQREDFEEFVRVRVLIGRAYHAVARRKGVAVDSDFPAEPFLAHESRLGLSLGRQEERCQARKQYIAAVLGAQSKERERTKGAGYASLDLEVLARAARRASRKHCKRAVEQASRHHQKVAQPDDKEFAEKKSRRQTTCPNLQNTIKTPWSKSKEAAVALTRAHRSPNLDSRNTRKDDSDEEQPSVIHAKSCPAETHPRATMVPLVNEQPPAKLQRTIFLKSQPTPRGTESRGFGLTVHELVKHGVSPTGHLLPTALNTGGIDSESLLVDLHANANETYANTTEVRVNVNEACTSSSDDGCNTGSETGLESDDGWNTGSEAAQDSSEQAAAGSDSDLEKEKNYSNEAKDNADKENTNLNEVDNADKDEVKLPPCTDANCG